METSRQQLAQRFGELSDEELLTHVHSGTLTPLALEVATGILSSRGLPPALWEADASEQVLYSRSERVQAQPRDVALVTIAEFLSATRAHVLRTCLEAHGIFAHVSGEHLATSRPLLSFAEGGTRVQVRANQLARAQEVLAAFQRGELAIPEAGASAPRRTATPPPHTGLAATVPSLHLVAPSGPRRLSRILLMLLGLVIAAGLCLALSR